MKNLLPYIFLLATILVRIQNDNCSGAKSLTVGANLAFAAITTNK
ncbi:hypothetical protein [Chryseobacterium sp. GVT01B]|nr:hypothetical protein [Chryseobacterium sp. GVT01B]